MYSIATYIALDEKEWTDYTDHPEIDTSPG